MARLRTLHPGNHRSSASIDDEFENVVRYIVAAEAGNKTLAELMSTLFDEDGELTAAIEIRLDGTKGLQYRIGVHTDPEEGWKTIAAPAAVRGTPGRDVGTIRGPLFYSRQEFVAAAGQTVFPYVLDTNTDDVFVFKNGVLQAPATYAKNPANITLSAGAVLNDKISVIGIRASAITNYRRSDLTSATQAVFPFVHDADEQILVFRNGLLQRFGGGADYTNSPDTDTITFTATLPANDLVTALTVENLEIQNVGGLMTEDVYTDGNGFVPWAKIAVADGAIAQAKINGLTGLLANRGHVFVQPAAPIGAVAGDFWIKTSVSPNLMFFFDGVTWLSTSSVTDIPSFLVADAGKALHVNGTGTGIEWKPIDLSSVVSKAVINVANGVAGLDALGKLSATQLPQIFALTSLFLKQAGAVANGTFVITKIYGQHLRLDKISRKASAGTGDVILQVNGVDVGTTYQATNALQENALTSSIDVDATTTAKTIGFRVANQAALADLEIVLAAAAVTA
jgi:hypothetical protein